MKKLTIVGLCLACTGLVLLTAVALTGGFKQVLSAERLPDFVRSAVPFSGAYQETDKRIRLADEAIESIEVDLSRLLSLSNFRSWASFLSDLR